MKFLFPLLLSLFLTTSLLGQKIEQGDFLFDLGVGVANHNGYNNVEFSPNVNSLSSSFHIAAAYSFSENLTIGINAKINSFGGSTDSTRTTTSVAMGFYYLNADYYFVNKEKFNLYGGLGFGVAGLNYEVIDSTDVGEFSLGGTSYAIKLGARRFFGEHIGIYLETGYTGAAMQMKELIINGTSQSDINGFPIEQHFFNINGLGIELGVSFRF